MQAAYLCIFKSNILKLIRLPMNVLNIHKRYSDAYRCEMSIETAEHFLVFCDLYTETRSNLFQVINLRVK